MGYLHVTFDEKGDLTSYHGQPILINNTIPQSPDVVKLLEEFRPEVEALNKEKVGKSRVFLDGRSEHCRFKECNFGNLMTDALVAYRMSVYGGNLWTDAPISVLNGGGIRNSVNASSDGGVVTRGELFGAAPFDNQVITLSLKGEDLLETLELGVRSNNETSRGEFLQVSGLKVIYDLRKPVGKRVVSVKVRCSKCEVPHYENLKLSETYRLVTTSFLVAGGDGHRVLKEKSFDKKIEDFNDLETICWYFKTFSPVFPGTEGRIGFATDEPSNVHPEKDSSSAHPVPLFSLIGLVVANMLRYL